MLVEIVSKSATDAGTVSMLSSTTCRDGTDKIALSAAACELSNLSITTVATPIVPVLVLDVCRRCLLLNLERESRKRIWNLFFGFSPFPETVLAFF